ncbi:MAG: type IV secretion system protein [Proteobacteria bacterium]|nr:type IV secretion system protein [Pseudomonadota bacterium]
MKSTPEPHKDEMGQMPIPAETVKDDPRLPHLYVNKINRALIVMVFSLIVLLGMSIGGYHFLLPLKEEVPVYIGLDMDSESFVYKLYPVRDQNSRDALAKYFLNNYVLARETVDRITEYNRVPQVLAMSSEDVYRVFESTMRNGPKALYRQEGFKREVNILRDGPVANRGPDYHIHEIDFQTIDTNERLRPGEKAIKEWNVKIAYIFSPQKVHLEKEGSLVNPAGLFVVEYTVTERRGAEVNAQ